MRVVRRHEDMEKAQEELQRAINEAVRLVEYSSIWPVIYQEEADRLKRLFPDSIVEIEHIGSTAVPGMPAKPIIDIMAGLTSLVEADTLLKQLCMSDYTTSSEFNATLTDSRWLMKQKGGHRTHHLHLVVYNGDKWKRRLQFRENLRSNPFIALEYARLKSDLADKYKRDREGYTKAKTEFIERHSNAATPN
jgi:GrpB-like predicted nucleotidyltransferase (UPF0157 family)